MNIMHKLAEDAIDIILAGCDDWIDDNQYHDFEGDYDWSDDDMCTLYFRVDGKYIGSWDVDIADIEDVNTLDNISAEVEAAVSGMERSEYVDDSGIDSRTGRKAGVPADFDGEDDEWDIENNKPFDSYYKESSSNIKENWQDDWVEPTIDPNPIDNINGLNIYKGTNQYGEEAYYLFLEDEDPEPGYEEWQAETLEIAREWASSYELAEADDFDDEDVILEKSRPEPSKMTRKGIPIPNYQNAQFQDGTYVEITALRDSSLGLKIGSKAGRVAGKVKGTYVYNFNDNKHKGNEADKNMYGDIYDANAPQSCVVIVHDDFRIKQHGQDTNRVIIPVSNLREIDEKTYKDIINKIPRKGFDKLFNKNKKRIESKLGDGRAYVEADDFDDEVKLNKNLQDLNEKLAPLKESAFDNDFILDIVKMGYETGYQIFDSYEDFIEDEEVQDIDDKEAAWDFYCNLIDMGPAGFYEEYKDELDFNEDFINKYDNDVINEECKKMRYVEADDFEDEVAPNAYNYIFKTLDKDYWDESDWSTIEDYDGDRCKVVSTEIQGPNFESSYHNIEFKDGTKFSAISGIHLQPVKKGYTKLKTESNGVSRNIPFTLDNFLQDVAQITGTISYLDIANFKYTEKDKASLNKLRSAWYDALDDDADDEVLQDIGSKVADYIKNKLKCKLRSECQMKIKVTEGSKQRDEWYSLSDWYNSEEGTDDITEYGQKLEELVMQKYPTCMYFEEPSIQGTQGQDYVSIDLDDEFFSFGFDWETLLENIFTYGPESAAKDSFNEIVEGITTKSALNEE